MNGNWKQRPEGGGWFAIWLIRAIARRGGRKVARLLLPQITLQEMLVAFKEVVVRSEMFSHHQIARERLSVRERMTNILATLERARFVDFVHLFRPEVRSFYNLERMWGFEGATAPAPASAGG